MNDADATPDLPGRLGVAVQLLAHAGKQAGKDAEKAGGGRGELTPTRLTALAVLADAGSMRLGGFASRLGVQVSTMSRIVDIMAASGWLERRPDEADHRACVIAITSAGSALLDAVRQAAPPGSRRASPGSALTTSPSRGRAAGPRVPGAAGRVPSAGHAGRAGSPA